MRTDSTTTERRFEFRDISEDEARVLRTLLNLSEKGVREKLNADKAYWDHRLSEEEAVEIGCQLVDQIHAEVDE